MRGAAILLTLALLLAAAAGVVKADPVIPLPGTPPPGSPAPLSPSNPLPALPSAPAPLLPGAPPPMLLPRIQGKWLFTVDSVGLKRSIRPTGTCAKNLIPIDLSEAFKLSVVQALRNVFDDIEEVASPVGDDEVKARKAKGVIVVRGGDIVGRVLVEVGVLLSHVNASATVSASVSVEIRKTRVLEAVIDGSSATEADLSGMCAGGQKTFTDVSAAAMQDAVRKLTDLLGNAQYLRAEK